MSKTPNYDLFVTDDAGTKFKDWREQMASESNSNMVRSTPPFPERLSKAVRSKLR